MNSTGGLCLSKPFSPETKSDRALPAESISCDAYLILPALNTARKGPSRPPSRVSPPLYLLNEPLTPSLLCNPSTTSSKQVCHPLLHKGQMHEEGDCFREMIAGLKALWLEKGGGATKEKSRRGGGQRGGGRLGGRSAGPSALGLRLHWALKAKARILVSGP